MEQMGHWMRSEMRVMRGAVDTLRCLASTIEFFGLAFLVMIVSIGLWSVW